MGDSSPGSLPAPDTQQPLPASHSVLSREDVRTLDQRTIEAGTLSLELMETAAERITAALLDPTGLFGAIALPKSDKRMLVLCGPGNNGGDGLAVARMLVPCGWSVDVVLCGPEPRAGSDAGVNLQRWQQRGGRVLDIEHAVTILNDPENVPDLILDALFGTGLDRDLSGEFADLVRAVNTSGVQVVSADIPSGLCSNTGAVLGVAVRADATITLGAAKPGLFLGSGPDLCGRIDVADIDLVPPLRAGLTARGSVLTAASSGRLVRQRRAATHKGESGSVLVVAGSAGKRGAGVLASTGALRTGAGLVTLASPDAARGTEAGRWQAAGTGSESWATRSMPAEVMTLGIDSDGSGGVGANAWADLAETSAGSKAIVAGCGLGRTALAADLVLNILANGNSVVVLDADALHALAEAAAQGTLAPVLEDRRKRGAGAIIVTPHPGEMAALSRRSVTEVLADRLGACAAVAREYRCITVLKGAGTIVHDGENVAFNTSGNPGMASPGMGDVLAGVVGAIAARSVAGTEISASAAPSPAFEAACLAVFLHGNASDRLYAHYTAPGFTASEVAATIPLAHGSLLRQRRLRSAGRAANAATAETGEGNDDE